MGLRTSDSGLLRDKQTNHDCMFLLLYSVLTRVLCSSSGRQVLGPAQKEQRGSQEVTGRPAAEGEPDRHPGQLPGEGEPRSAHGGSRDEEGAGPLQEHCG